MSKSLNTKSVLVFFVVFFWFSVIPTISFSAWTIEVVDSAGEVGESTSIAVDSNNGVHISYYDRTNQALKYATNASGFWVIETVDVGGGYYSSIAVDSNDWKRRDTSHIS